MFVPQIVILMTPWTPKEFSIASQPTAACLFCLEVGSLQNDSNMLMRHKKAGRNSWRW